MPDSCFFPICSERRVKGKKLSFFTIPSAKKHAERRALWINAIKRDNWEEDCINRARICGKHFHSGKPSLDKLNPDYVPSLFAFKKNKAKSSSICKRYERLQRRRTQIAAPVVQNVSNSNTDETVVADDECVESTSENMELSDDEYADDVQFDVEQMATSHDKGTETDFSYLKTVHHLRRKVIELNRENTILKVKDRNKKVPEPQELSFKLLSSNVKKFKFYTGLNNITLFKYIVELMVDVTTVYKLDREDHVLVVLIKLRLGLLNKDLAYRFQASETAISNIFRKWLPALASQLDFLLIWPGKEALMENVPKSFRKSYYNCTGIIDCTEIFICKPSGMEQKAITWSSYKNNNTIKYLICVTPSGAISFISDGWSGRVPTNI